MTDFFPDIIRSLPQADIPIEGLRSWLFQGAGRQVVFMEFSKDAEVPEHSHEAQWGIVLEGKMELTVGNRPRLLQRGDSYSLRAGEKHSARISAGYKDLTFFNQEDRYRPKG